MFSSYIYIERERECERVRERENKSVRDRETAWACCSRSLCLCVCVHAWEPGVFSCVSERESESETEGENQLGERKCERACTCTSCFLSYLAGGKKGIFLSIENFTCSFKGEALNLYIDLLQRIARKYTQHRHRHRHRNRHQCI